MPFEPGVQEEMPLLSHAFECLQAIREALEPVIDCADALPHDALQWETARRRKLSFSDAKPVPVYDTTNHVFIGQKGFSCAKVVYSVGKILIAGTHL
jgi:hypothetical protein